MTRAIFLASLVAMVMLASTVPARAQSWEVSGLGGYTTGAAIDRTAPELDDLDVQGGFTWGAQVARFFTPALGVEAMWTEQFSGLELGTASGSATLFTLSAGQLFGNVVYRFGAADARWQPFVFAGLGMTFFDADDVPGETKFSLGVGGGVKHFFTRTLGARAHVRYKWINLNDESAGDFCDPFGFCQGGLSQFEIMAGGVVRF